MTVIVLRHGESRSNVARTLAGRTPGVELTERGLDQARELADRLGGSQVRAIVRSPLLRCAQTVAPLAAALDLEPVVDEHLAEVDYGEWTGRPIAELIDEPLWRVVQQHPSAVEFPGGERLAAVQYRAVRAIREHDRRLAEQHGTDVVWLACTHGDVIKSVLADALGMHLDGFQRIVVEPAALSVIRYTPGSAYVHRMNVTGGGPRTPIAHPADKAGTGQAPGGDVAQSGSEDNEAEGDDPQRTAARSQRDDRS
ncbi:histidine phosphatase family protein [Skermania piniformis]|uniref:MSMEG_4193 family putative phosphomutase n=1 Tax=Skermania pinensis TaxID=39122 RepID=A0ABX8SCF4_9ACTN|nr:histidine phosphatase family protein [Skermania piniformis]QXQ15549.1 MSMEG_4193 family putative phosphomutase [Skermania piniformis]